MDVSLVIPVYNGELTLEKLYSSIRAELNGKLSYEVIFVYDCGKDQSWPLILKLKARYSEEIKAVRLSRNFGQHNAIICGFRYATGNFIVTMDEDGQHDPADIPLLLKVAQDGPFDVVYGNPVLRRHDSWRNWTSNLMKRILRAAIPELPPYYSAYRIICAKAVKLLPEMQNSYTFLDGYLTWITRSFSCCEVKHHERIGGESGYDIRKLIEHSVNILVTFSNLPLRMVTVFSIVLLVCVFLYSAYVVMRTLIYHDLSQGFPTLIIVSAAGFSLVLFAIGVVGEYVFQINQKTTRRPNYVVSEEV